MQTYEYSFTNTEPSFHQSILDYLEYCGFVLGDNLLSGDHTCLHFYGKYNIARYLVPSFVQAYNIINTTHISCSLVMDDFYAPLPIVDAPRVELLTDDIPF